MSTGIVTLTSDFGVQSQGVGLMELAVLAIEPGATVVHLMHGLPAFDIAAAARTLETVRFGPIANHVCVCDPGVGTDRKGIVGLTARGDHLIGPNNGVLRIAATLLGGFVEVRELLNPEMMNPVVSPIFHGRDVFAPAAAHLCGGVPLEQFGPTLGEGELVGPPYPEACWQHETATLQVIQINKFGSVHVNFLAESWLSLPLTFGRTIEVVTKLGKTIPVTYCHTFADVPKGCSLILCDDYGRIEIAINQGSFAMEHDVSIGDGIQIRVEPQ